MPELPEVETVLRGISPLLTGKTIASVTSRVAGLRWPLPPRLNALLKGKTLRAVTRRAKYLLLDCGDGTLILHLGMTGHLRVIDQNFPPSKHDHLDIIFADGRMLRFNDSRRFGAVLWTADDPQRHPLLADLGPEPLDSGLTGDYLYERARGRKIAVKPFIMDQKIVVGVGNIYASEALFYAGIHPAREAGRISLERYERLAARIRDVLEKSIEVGGTTIRNFSNSEGKPGYFALQLQMYGKEGEPCPGCGRPIRQSRIGQRSTYFCPYCQR